MRKALAICLGAGAVLGCLVAAAVILFAGAGSAASGMLTTGRAVTTTSDSLWLRSRYQGNTATVETAGHTIVVMPDRVLVDGRPYARLSPSAKDVRLTVANQDIRIAADGRDIPSLR